MPIYSKNVIDLQKYSQNLCVLRFCWIDGADFQNYTKPGPPLLRVGCFIALPRIITVIIFVFGQLDTII